MEKIPHEFPIFRAIKKRVWKIEKHSAFFLRRELSDGKPEEELSVTTKADCTKDICFANLNTCFGEFKLMVEKIRQLGLDVVPRPLPDNPHHAAIVNLPLYTDETIEEAERMARLLAKQISNVKDRPS